VAVAAPEEVLALLREVADAAVATGRTDLAERVAARSDRLAGPEVCVVVAGEFKTGKSSLVNALVGADVCPVDDDVATSVPTVVRFAAEPGLRVRRAADDTDDGEVPEAVERLAAYVTEAGNPENNQEVRLVEVGIPSELLRGGLVLVDTPGVGGLRSTYASATLTALAMAHAMVFVSDASQELTRPELDFLAAAQRACPEIVAVLSKVDIAPEWRRIQELNAGWLAAAGVSGALVPTSAALHQRGRLDGRTDLRAESGVEALMDRLDDVTRRFREALGDAALDEAQAVLGQLAAPVRAEHDALLDPVATIEELERGVEQARRLAADGDWAAELDDGMIDLEDQVDKDLARRMKAVLADAEGTVRATDPATSWDEFGAALARQVSAEISAVAVALSGAANDLAARLAEEFAAHEASISPLVTVPTAVTAGGDGRLTLRQAGTPWRGVLVDAGWGGLEALGVLGSILTFTSISLFNPFSLVIGVFIGGKTLRDARRREVDRRREQASASVAQYVQDATQAADRELKSTSRRIRRELRTTYQRRADALLRSAQDSLAAAERTIGTDAGRREERRGELGARLAALESLAQRAARL
jgi:hypothetical protein